MIWNFDSYEQNTALVDDKGTSVSYRELKLLSEQLSEIIGRRTLVVLLCSNSIGSIVGYVGCVNNNIVPILLSANLERESLYNTIDIYKPEFIWVPAEQIGEFVDYMEMYSIYGYSLLKTGFNIEYSLNEELCLLLTTSGSTGSSKYVRQSYKNVKSNLESIVTYLELDSKERPITTLPMNYTYGLSIINSHLNVGAMLLVTDKTYMQKEFWEFFKQEKATSFGGVPYTYEILSKLKFFRMDLPYLKYMTQAGGKLSLELHEKFASYAKENNKRFIVMYGQCEATARMGYLPADKAVEKCGSMGIAIPGGEFSLVDNDGQYITDNNVTGELVYQGANVTLGYAECGNDLIKGDEFLGVLKTGDMAYRDDDGYYYIIGRKKRFLKIYGNRVNLDEIDSIIKEQFNSIECVSSGEDDHLYVFLTDDEKASEIKDFLAFKTKLNPVAFKIIKIDSIPKNESGKILYKELERYYK